MIDYAKILIFGHQFDTKTGLGITLSNLFANWPKESIGIMAASVNIDECEKAKPCGIYIGSTVLKQMSAASYNNKVRNAIKDIYYKLGLSDIKHNWSFTAEQIGQAKSFNPDVVFCCLGSYGAMKECCQIMEILPNAKLVLYIVDDWVNTKSSRRYFKHYWDKKNNELFKHLLDKASGLLSICPFMSESYLKQYGKTFYPFHNPVDLNYWKSLPSELKYPDDTISILFTGKINEDTKDCLIDTCKVVEQLNNESHKFVFDVYSPNANMHPDLFSQYPSCHLFAAIPHDEIPTATKGYSAMLLTLGFSKISRKYVRLSMPTKLSEYLAAGIPTVLYCPEEIALSQYLKDKDCVFHCYERDNAKLRDCMLALENKETCLRKVDNALKLAEDHDMPVVRERFEQQMIKFLEQ